MSRSHRPGELRLRLLGLARSGRRPSEMRRAVGALSDRTVSVILERLEQEGLVAHVDNLWRITDAGTAHLRRVRRWLDGK